MLHPKELMSMVIGLNLSSVDFSDLETVSRQLSLLLTTSLKCVAPLFLLQHMRYENGYTADHPTIRFFWIIFNSFTLEAKRKLLRMLQ